ncbi:MAG: 8-amino-7-oxononanoate synthase [Thermodesulfobacteriota bacterium]
MHDILWNKELDLLRDRDLYRSMPAVSGLPGRLVNVNGIQAINFSSNNYLGLAENPAVMDAAVEYTRRYGAGATASRLIVGNNEPHRELETFIAAWKGTEAALIFNSGYQANVGILSSLMEGPDQIVSDELNHASIIDGCRLSRAKVDVFPHLDLERLERLLTEGAYRRRLVVTESVFSMDGDVAPLAEIHGICRKHGALLMVDEAHATGVMGPAGTGLAAQAGVIPDIQMGTLGKAVGTAGAYVAGSRTLIELLINKARSFIFSTALPPGVVGSALTALRIIASEEGDRRRVLLATRVEKFRELLTESLGAPTSHTHIIPVRIGDSALAMKVAAECLQQGVFAHGIRHPSVPEGTARLRFTITSEHTEDDLRIAVEALTRAMKRWMNRKEPATR